MLLFAEGRQFLEDLRSLIIEKVEGYIIRALSLTPPFFLKAVYEGLILT